MDKVGLLREFENTKAGKGLMPWDVRLYLLLLVSAKDEFGEIESRSIRKVFGKVFMPGLFPPSCRRLMKAGLIEISGESLEKLNGEDFTLRYKLLDLKSGS